MKRSFIFLAILIATLILAFSYNKVTAWARLTDSFTSDPSSCPAGGCAAGQRINANASITITTSSLVDPNTQICLYALATGNGGADPWIDPLSFSGIAPGGYTEGDTDSLCSSYLPAGYSLIYSANGERTAGIDDTFSFAFRINKTTNISGELHFYSFQYDGINWLGPTDQSIFYPVTAVSGFSYVASSAANCGGYNPCYLNSGDDLPGGIGTGLKDAIDAGSADATITILGTYSIKSNTISVNKTQTLRGINDASLTSSGTACSNTMLSVTDGATIRDLNINDGSCASPSRDLISIDSATLVKVLNNDLVNGKDAVSILNNAGDVSFRFNLITGNSGYGVLRAPGGAGTLKAVANNIYNNRSGVQVECNNQGIVDHNFWGNGIAEASAISNCAFTTGKRLGAAVVANSSAPGVAAQQVSVTGTKTGYFNNQIAVDGTEGSQIILVNHGNGSPGDVPFLGYGTEDVTACSNFWDVFVSDENPVIPSLINLYIKYSLNADCISTTESLAFCGGTDQASYPLLWFDPQDSITYGWDTTGQIPDGSNASGLNGQTTTCDMANDEIRVAIDNSIDQRPNLLSDLNFTPFVIGYRILFSSFTATSGIAQIDLHWETSTENSIKGFYVVRSLNQNGPFFRTSDLIPSKGDTNIGGIYNYTDTGLSNGTTYWYKLEIIDESGDSLGFNDPISVATYNMLPMLSQVTPTTTLIDTALSISLTGNNFVLTSKVCWNGTYPSVLCSGGTLLDTSYTDANKLNAVIPEGLLHYAGLNRIYVINPAPGGGTSTQLYFTVNNTIPTISKVTPDRVDGLGASFEITVTGSNFIYLPSDVSKKSKIYWNGSNTGIEMTYFSATVLKAKVSADRLKTYGSISIIVYNPSPGGGSSNSIILIVNTPTPTLTRTPTTYRTRTNTPYYTTPVPSRTRTRTPTRTPTRTSSATLTVTGLISPSATINLVGGSETPGSKTPVTGTPATQTPVPSTPTTTLAPGEPTYTPAPPPAQEENPEISQRAYRIYTILRILAGSLAGIGLVSIPAFMIFRSKTKIRSSH